MKVSQLYNLLSSFLIFLFLIISSNKDQIAIYTIGIGSFLLLISSLIRIIEEISDKVLIENKQIPVRFMAIGIILEIIGMFTARFQAVFHITAIPFSFYLLLSLLITLQLRNVVSLLLDGNKDASQKNQPMTEPSHPA